MDAERRAQRLAARLAVDLEGVVARLGRERVAAAAAMGDAERADAGAAGALLAPCLGAGHRDLAPGQARVRAAAARVHVGARRLVDERLVVGLAEERLGQVGLRLLADVVAFGSAIGAHLHGSVLRARDRAAQHQQVALGVDRG